MTPQEVTKLKATELMIGDWVQYLDEDLERTFQIKEIKKLYKNQYVVTEDGCSDEFLIDHTLCPIPLTVEILDNNGLFDEWYNEFGHRTDRKLFHNGDDFFTQYFKEDTNKNLGIFKDGNIIYMSADIGWIIISYVHQLQHAIKLCGIEKEIVL